MDLDIIQSTKEGEITQFLCDVRDYFRASLATSEYENTSNMFFMTESDVTEQLLQRCEQLLNRLGTTKCQSNSFDQQNLITYTIPKPIGMTTVTNGLQNQWQTNKDNIKHQPPAKNQQQQHQQQQQHHHQTHVTSKAINGSFSPSQPDKQQSVSPSSHLYQQLQQQQQQQHQQDDVSYLDMSAANNKKKISPSRDVNIMNSSVDSDKTFRCSTMIVKQNKSFLHRLHDTMTTTTDEEAETDSIDGQLDDDFEDDPQIYDICQVTTQGSDGEEDHVGNEETQKAITPESLGFTLPHMECPYMDLPAGHLAIHKSAKYGQLQRIEKRLFFDQSKKCYCGILNDWMLCYADGPTSNKPSISLYLKMPGIEIEHFGEGKRRDVCFQISTADPSKRFVFQAVNEIDAKEWIHAIEAAIRSDLGSGGGNATALTTVRNSSARKLPTPPVMKKMTFLSTFQKANDMKHNTNANSSMTTSLTASDCIYEEPSPVYNVTNMGTLSPPDLPQKQNSPSAMAERFEYDVPKCPPLPLANDNENVQLINPYDMEKTPTETLANNSSTTISPNVNLNFITPPKINLKMEEKLNFQAKVKDVHSKLSSQLTNGPIAAKKPLKKTYSSASSSSQQDGESLIMSTSPINTSNSTTINSTSPTSFTGELKKQKKSSTPPQNSPQKSMADKTSATKNWFLNRLNKTTSSTRSNASLTSSHSNAPSKGKQSEKENLLNSSDQTDENNDSSVSSNPASPILKSSSSAANTTTSPMSNGKGKVNMLINQLEASGHLASIFTADAVASFSSFCDNDCNNYEPIMTVSSPPSSFLKKV